MYCSALPCSKHPADVLSKEGAKVLLDNKLSRGTLRTFLKSACALFEQGKSLETLSLRPLKQLAKTANTSISSLQTEPEPPGKPGMSVRGNGAEMLRVARATGYGIIETVRQILLMFVKNKFKKF